MPAAALTAVLTAASAEKSRAISSVKEQSILIESQSEELFGKAFRKHIRDTAKARKVSKEVYNKPQQRLLDDHITNRNNNRRPFPKSSSFSKQNGEAFRRICFKKNFQFYEFLRLCFGLAPAPCRLMKLMKIPVVILRRINIRMIFYLDDFVRMSQTIEDLEMARDTLIFLFQQLGFVINLKKSVLTPNQLIEFLGLMI